MIKKKLEKHDFSTHEGLKKYVLEYVKQEEKDYRFFKYLYLFFAVFSCVAGLGMYFNANTLINQLASIGASILGPILFIWIVSVEKRKIELYREKINLEMLKE